MSAALAQAHSVVAPTPLARRVAATVVIIYALVTMIPLLWIVLTSFKTPDDSIAYPPKLLIEPSIIAASSYSRGISSMKPLSSQTASETFTAV